MKISIIIGCTIVGLGLGYFAGSATRSSNGSDPAANSAERSDRGTISSPEASPAARATRRPRAEREFTFTVEQVNSMLEQPQRFHLQTSRQSPTEEGGFLPVDWSANLAKFLALDELQAARFDQKLRTFSMDAHQLIQNHAEIDTSKPGEIRIGLGGISEPFRQRIEVLDDDWKSFLGQQNHDRLKAVTDFESVASSLSEDSALEIDFTAHPGPERSYLNSRFCRKGNPAEEKRMSLSYPNSGTNHYMNSTKFFDLFEPELDWESILKQQMEGS